MDRGLVRLTRSALMGLARAMLGIRPRPGARLSRYSSHACGELALEAACRWSGYPWQVPLMQNQAVKQQSESCTHDPPSCLQPTF
jgi:hypothetical protein